MRGPISSVRLIILGFSVIWFYGNTEAWAVFIILTIMSLMETPD